jgi:hypothetical protein
VKPGERRASPSIIPAGRIWWPRNVLQYLPRHARQLGNIHRDQECFAEPVLWRLFGRVARQPTNTNAARMATKIANCISSAMLLLHSFLSAEARACDRSLPACRAVIAAPARHVDCRDCSEDKASPHRTNRHPPGYYRPSAADRHDPRTPSRYRRTGRTPYVVNARGAKLIRRQKVRA